MADFVATIQVAPGQTLWRAEDVPHLTADALYRFEPEPDPLTAQTELRRFTSVNPRSQTAGRQLNARELAHFARRCREAGLLELPGELLFSCWGEYLEAFNQDAQSRGWWAGLIPPRDPHQGARLSWICAVEEHRKLLKEALRDGKVQARMAGSNVPAKPGMVALDHLVLTRRELETFAAMLAMSVMDSPATVPDSTAPVVSAPAAAEPAVVAEGPKNDRGARVKRAALIDRNRHRWPSIEGDLHEASSNALSAGAKTDKHGFWWEGDALKWAEARNKLEVQTASMSLAGVVHRLKG